MEFQGSILTQLHFDITASNTTRFNHYCNVLSVIFESIENKLKMNNYYCLGVSCPPILPKVGESQMKTDEKNGVLNNWSSKIEPLQQKTNKQNNNNIFLNYQLAYFLFYFGQAFVYSKTYR